MANDKRTSATTIKGLGDSRYERYVGAFDWVDQCIKAGYYLEAIAILDSLVSDRLCSRLGYLVGHEIRARLTSGDLCKELLEPDRIGRPGAEQDPAFKAVIAEIQKWVSLRYGALQGGAKVLLLLQAGTSFHDLLNSFGLVASEGRELLRWFDALDTVDRRRNAGRQPASSPYAFFPEGRR